MNRFLIAFTFSAIVLSSSFAQERSSTPSRFSGFTPNKGQIANEKSEPLDSIDFKLEAAGVNAYFTPSGIVYHFYREYEKESSEYTKEEQEAYNRGDYNEVGKKVFFYRMDFRLIGANQEAEIKMEQESKSYTNYYLASCPEGITNVHSYSKVTYEEIYPNIDLVYLTENGELKYEFIVKPGGNIEDIQFKYDGADDINLRDGNLEVSNGFGPFMDDAPFSFYELESSEIESEYKIEDGIVSFKVEEYDASKTLVIDPTISWSTYYDNGGGSDFHANSAYDSDENMYLAYASYSSAWTTVNAGAGQYYDAIHDGSLDLVIVRFNSDMTLQWATYYGGDASDVLCGTGGDYGKTIDVSDNDDIYVGGHANSNPTTFPTLSSGVGGAWYQDQTNLKGGDNSFLLKFDQNGVRQWATLYQHTNVSTSGAGIRINGIKCNGDKVYFTGQTYQFSGFDIPIVSLGGAYNNSTFVGNQDVFLGRFSSDCILEWSTYFNSGNVAANGYQQGSDITFDASGNMILAGQVSNDNLGVNTVNPGGGAYYVTTVSGFIDHTITKFNTSLQPTWSTIIGGTDLDRVSEVSTDPSGNILVASRIVRDNVPTANPGGGAFFIGAHSGNDDGFIMKFTPGGVYTWGTYVGASTAFSSMTGIIGDENDNVYAIGYTQATNFPIQSNTGSYNQSTIGGSNDLVLMRFNSLGVNEWSTYYGGTLSETCYGIKIEPSTIANSCGFKQFFSPASQSTNTPTTNPGGGAFFEGTLSGTSSRMIVSYEEAGGSVGTAPTSISGTTTICSGSSTTLTQVGGSLGTGDTYEWYSGSCGGTSVGSGTSVMVSPTTTTTYYVRAEGTCGITACASVTVTVNPSSTAPTGITVDTNPLCPGGNTDLTVQGGSLGTGASFEWYTGSCGGTSAGSGATINVSPATTTTYYVRAEGTCNTTACASVTVTVNSESTAATSISSAQTTICDGDTETLTVSGGSLGTGATWEWYTGSCGGTSAGTGTSISPSPSTTTTYYVRAEGTCNTTACASVTITVNPVPNATVTSSGADICDGATLNLTGTPAGGTWSVTSGPGTIATDVLSTTGAGIINLEYSVTTLGCTGTDTQSITVLTASDGSWTSPGTVCETAGILDLNTLITGDAGGTWSGTGVTGSNFDPTGQNGNTITITYDVGTTCPDQVQHDITVETSVSAAWTLPSALCESDSPLDLATLVTGSAGGSWTGTGISGSNFDPAGLVGMNTVTYNIGSGSCSDMLAQDIEVLSSPVAPTFEADDSTVCAGATVNLTGSGSGTVDYNVYSDAGGTTLLGTAPLAVNPSVTTTYYLEAEGTNGCGNIGGLQPLTITVTALPTLTVSSDQNICLGQDVTLQATGSGTLLWSTSEITSEITVSPITTTTYTVSLTDGNGCTANESVDVNVQSSVTVSAVDDIAMTDVDALVNIDVAANDNGDPLTVSIIESPANGIASVQTDGTIDYLPLSGYIGSDSLTYSICDVFCSTLCDTAIVRIEIQREEELSVPGGFSPNGDGINENLVIEGLDAYPENSLTIFNRWGDIIYTSSPYNNDWSGQAEGARTITGDVVVTGTYFYILELDENTEALHGSIEIKK
jgi:gliding motility-associated-like protein